MEKIISRISVLLILSVIICPVTAISGRDKDRVKIIKVEYEGNSSYSDSKIAGLTITKKSGLFKRRWFDEKNTEEDMERISRFYTDNGYLDVNTSYEKKLKKSDRAKIIFKIEEGERYRTGDIIFEGNKYYEESRLKPCFKFERGGFFTRQEIDSAVTSVMALYANNGFIEVQVQADLTVNSKDKKVDISILVDEKKQYKAGENIISGFSKTRPKIITREIVYKEDEYIDASKLLQTQHNLFLTGLFSNVRLRPGPSRGDNADIKDLMIELSEKDSVELGLSVGYDSLEKFWQQAELYNYNFRGRAQKAGVMARRSEIKNSIEISFSEPRLWGSRWRGDTGVFMNAAYEPGYTLHSRGGKISAGRELNDVLNLAFSYKTEKIRYSDLGVDYIAPRQTQWRNLIAVTSSYDTRDSVFNTLKGTFLEQMNEYIFLDKDLLRIIFRGRQFFSVSDIFVIATAAELSFVVSDAAIEEIEPALRFYTGGPNSIRGFRYNMAGPLNEAGLPTGGKVKFVWNIVELRLMLTKIAGIELFVDAGNVWENIDKTAISKLNISPGLGVLAATPLGVFRLEYAFLTRPRQKWDKGIFYFGSGFAF